MRKKQILLWASAAAGVVALFFAGRSAVARVRTNATSQMNNETGMKTICFAGGDAVTGAATVILAMGAGKVAAKAMDEYLVEKYNLK